MRNVVPEGAAEVRRKLLDILDEAIEQERLAQKRYAFVASLATDPAAEEMGHERTLREWQLALGESG